jgi:hypothetical protein
MKGYDPPWRRDAGLPRDDSRSCGTGLLACHGQATSLPHGLSRIHIHASWSKSTFPPERTTPTRESPAGSFRNRAARLPTVIRCYRTEEILQDDPKTIDAAKGVLAREITPFGDIRSTADYRLGTAANRLEARGVLAGCLELIRAFAHQRVRSPKPHPLTDSKGLLPSGILRCAPCHWARS